MNEQEIRLVADLSAAFHFRAGGPAAPAWLSPTFFALTGADPGVASGWRLSDAVAAADRTALIETWHEAARSDSHLDTEVRVTVADGTERWYRLRAVRTDQRDGGPPSLSWVGVGLDVHERRALERQRNELERQRNEAVASCAHASRQTEVAGQLKTQFLATASHELRTPLNAIAGWLHVLKMRAGGDPQQHQALAALERNVLAETKLIDSLLDVSRLTRGLESISPVVLDLSPLVRGCVTHMMPVASTKGVAMSVTAPVEPVLVKADPPKIEQVVRHLVGNAIQYSEQSGTVAVSVQRHGLDARLRVQDSGEGIAPDFLP